MNSNTITRNTAAMTSNCVTIVINFIRFVPFIAFKCIEINENALLECLFFLLRHGFELKCFAQIKMQFRQTVTWFSSTKRQSFI